MNKSPSIKRIGVFGPWGVGNLGCAATLESMIQNINRYIPGSDIVGFSLIPQDTQKRHGIPTYPIDRYEWDEHPSIIMAITWKFADWLESRPTHLLKKMGRWAHKIPTEFMILYKTFCRLKRLDLLIVVGGGQLLDFWGGPWTHPYWLAKFAILSKLAGTEFMFVSVGAGPLRNKLSRFFCKIALSLADYRSYRDLSSKRFIEKVVRFKKNDPVYPDLAYSLNIEQYDQRVLKHRSVVGIGVIAYSDPRYWPENDLAVYNTYLNKLSSFVGWVIERHYNVTFFLGEAQPDLLALRDLVDILNIAGVRKPTGELFTAEPIQTITDLLEQIANMDLVVASRLHNVLLPILFEKPVIALSYHPKVDALMAESGQAKYCLPIDTFDLDTLKQRFIDLERDCESIKIQFSKQVITNKAALNKQYERIFTNL